MAVVKGDLCSAKAMVEEDTKKVASFSSSVEAQLDTLNGKLTNLSNKACDVFQCIYGEAPGSVLPESSIVSGPGVASRMNAMFSEMNQMVSVISEILETI